MSQNQRTRSKLLIGAIMKGAATGNAPSLARPGKFAAIAGLAGFVLRLFRSRETPPGLPAAGQPRRRSPLPRRGRAARIRQGSSKADRREVWPAAEIDRAPHQPVTKPATKGGTNHG